MATRKPCPGCGEVIPSRKAGEVCWRCAERISKFEHLERQIEALRGWETAKLIRTSVNSRYEESVRILSPIINALPKDKYRNPIAPSVVVEGIRKAQRKIFEYGKREYKDGVDYGSNLLRRLNNGELSQVDFELRRNKL